MTIEHLMLGAPTLEARVEGREDTKVREGDGETVQTFKELLEPRIRPAIMDIEFKSFSEEGEMLLKTWCMSRTWDSSVVTLKNGRGTASPPPPPSPLTSRYVLLAGVYLCGC